MLLRPSFLVAYLSVGATLLVGQPYLTDEAWLDETARLIAEHRQGELSINLVDHTGAPLTEARYRLTQQDHAFAFQIAAAPNFREGRDARQLEAFRFLDPEAGVVNIGDGFDPASDFRDAAMAEALLWLLEEGYDVGSMHLFWKHFADTEELAGEALHQRLETSLKHKIDYLAPITGPLVWNFWNEPVTNSPFTNNSLTDPRVPYPVLADLARQARARLDAWGHEETGLIVNETGAFSGEGVPRNIADEGVDFFTQFGVPLFLEFFLEKLKENDAPLSGVGFQQHWKLDGSTPQMPVRAMWKMHTGFDRMAAVFPDLYITEFDVLTRPLPSLEEWEEEARLADALMRTWFAHPRMVGIAWFGGLRDDLHWLGSSPFYDRSWNLKPTGQVWMDLVHGEWSSRETGSTGNDGIVAHRLFYGTHRLTVEARGERATFVVEHSKDGPVEVTYAMQFLASAFPAAERVDTGVYAFGPLGEVRTVAFPWVEVEAFGEALYMVPGAPQDGGIWFFSQRKGWFWTSEQTYPWCFFANAGWFWYFEDPAYPYLHYEAATQQWVELPANNFVGEHLVQNGDFAFHLLGWDLTHEAAENISAEVAMAESGDPILRVAADAAVASEAIQLSQPLAVWDGFRYGLQVRGRAEPARVIPWWIAADDPWGTRLHEGTLSIGPTMAAASASFPSQLVAPGARLVLGLGGPQGTVDIENVQLVRLDRDPAATWTDGAAEAVEPIELVTNGNFAEGLDGWELAAADDGNGTIELVPGPEPGQTVARITNTGSVSRPDRLMLLQDVYLQADTTYTVSFLHRTEEQQREFEIQFLGDEFPRMKWRDKHVASGPAWQTYVRSFTVRDAGMVKMRVAVGDERETVYVGALSLLGPQVDDGTAPQGIEVAGSPWRAVRMGQTTPPEVEVAEDGSGMMLSGAAGSWGERPLDGAFVYQEFPTERGVMVTARLDALSAGEAGLAVRASTHPAAVQAFLAVDETGGITMRYVREDGYPPRPEALLTDAVTSFPVWLQITQEGHAVTGWWRADAQEPWQKLRTVVLPLGPSVLGGVGFAAPRESDEGVFGAVEVTPADGA